MTRQDDVNDLAANMGALPHPDLGTLALVNFTTFPGQDEELQGQIRTFTTQVAEGIFTFFDQRGKVLVDKSELQQPLRLGTDSRLAALVCATCGARMLEIAIDNQGLASVPASVVNEFTHECHT